jgi:hypothetical protein
MGCGSHHHGVSYRRLDSDLVEGLLVWNFGVPTTQSCTGSTLISDGLDNCTVAGGELTGRQADEN